jgi:transposase
MIRSTKHYSQLNRQKQQNLNDFVDEYRRVTQIILDEIWKHGYSFTDKNNNVHTFNVKTDQLRFPSYIDYNDFDIQTALTARAMSSLVTQLAGAIRASTEKQRKRLYSLQKLKSEGKTKHQLRTLIRKIKQNVPQKPNVENLKPEISSKCCDWRDNALGGHLRIKSIFRDKRTIIIPVRYHKRSRHWSSKGKRMNSFLVDKDCVNVRWSVDVPKPPKKRSKVIGVDQGLKDVLSLSDGRRTPKIDTHGHSLESITDKLTRKRKGSKAFRRAQTHRRNFIHWSINSLNTNNIDEIRMERIWNIGYRNKRSRRMSHWTNTIIRDKVQSLCEETGVQFSEQNCTYRSQRCSCCGLVRKANRKSKIYTCKSCGFTCDADVNAAKNHETDLPEIPYTLRKAKQNRGDGFYWKPEGFFDLSGRSLESLLPVEV